MSYGTRSQQAQAHERLRRRAENFRPAVPQAEALHQVVLQVLNDVPADSTFDADDVGEMIFNMVPGLNDILSDNFMSSPTYSIVLLREVSNFYGCLPMPVSIVEGIRDEFKTQSPRRHISRLLAAVYGM